MGEFGLFVLQVAFFVALYLIAGHLGRSGRKRG